MTRVTAAQYAEDNLEIMRNLAMLVKRRQEIEMEYAKNMFFYANQLKEFFENPRGKGDTRKRGSKVTNAL